MGKHTSRYSRACAAGARQPDELTSGSETVAVRRSGVVSSTILWKAGRLTHPQVFTGSTNYQVAESAGRLESAPAQIQTEHSRRDGAPTHLPGSWWNRIHGVILQTLDIR